MLRIHFACLFVFLMDGLLYWGGGISFRGQWLDMLIALGPGVTAIWTIIRGYKRLAVGWQIYFGAFTGACILAPPLLVLSFAIIPLKVHAHGHGYEARSLPGILSEEGSIQLIRQVFLFEYPLESIAYCNTDVEIVVTADSAGIICRQAQERDTMFVGRR